MHNDTAIAARGLLVLIGLLLILIWLTGCASIPPIIGCFGGYTTTGHAIECGVRLLR